MIIIAQGEKSPAGIRPAGLFCSLLESQSEGLHLIDLEAEPAQLFSRIAEEL